MTRGYKIGEMIDRHCSDFKPSEYAKADSIIFSNIVSSGQSPDEFESGFLDSRKNLIHLYISITPSNGGLKE